MKRLEVVYNFAKKSAKKKSFTKEYINAVGDNFKDSLIHPISYQDRRRYREDQLLLNHPKASKALSTSVGATLGASVGALGGGPVGAAVGAGIGAGVGLASNVIRSHKAKVRTRLYKGK